METIIDKIFGIIFLFVIFILPFILTILNIRNLFSKKKIYEMYTDLVILFLGGFLTFNFLSINDGTLFQSEFVMIWFSMFVVIGFIGMIKLVADDVYSSVEIIVHIDFILIGMIVSVLYTIQIFNNLFNGIYHTNKFTVYFFLFPFNYILSGIRIIRKNIELHTEYFNICCNIPKNKFIFNLQEKFCNNNKQPFLIFKSFLLLVLVMFPLSMVLTEIILRFFNMIFVGNHIL